MAEHFPEGGTRRGRRSPQIEVALEAELEPDEDRFEDQTSMSILRSGDSMMCRVSLEHPTAAGAGWFSWGATTTVGPDEDEADAAERLAESVTSRVYELIDGVTDTVESAVAEQKAQKRSRRINPGT